MAEDFVPHAEAAGLMPKIDNLLLFRSVQVLRRLLLKDREIGVFCNVSSSTLRDPEFFSQFSDFMDANRALAPASDVRVQAGRLPRHGAGRIRKPGCAREPRLPLLDGSRHRSAHGAARIVRARLPLPQGFRRNAGQERPCRQRGHSSRRSFRPPGALSHRPDRRADRERERVVDLLDFDVRFGQGFLFSPPRPVRVEAMQANGGECRGQARRQRGPCAPAGHRALPMPQSSSPAWAWWRNAASCLNC